jgi:putative SOS response-associated peptidase YedK
MEKIHNSKKRMPVIIPRVHEKDWLNPNLTEAEVMELCIPIDPSLMDAYTISRAISSRSIDNKNIQEISKQYEYPELAIIDA